MEPAGDRPGDQAPTAWPPTTLMPQWSRPMVGRATCRFRPPGHVINGPQWSRPMVGRATDFTPDTVRQVIAPQWSRPMVGRATRPAGRRPGAPRRAAMEPADGRPGDRVACRASRLECLAAMEPADGRPGDAGYIALQDRRAG